MKIKNVYEDLLIADCGNYDFTFISDNEKDAMVYSDKDNKLVYLSGVAAYIYLFIIREFQTGTQEISSKEIAQMIVADFETMGESLSNIIDDVEETIHSFANLNLVTVE